MKIKCAASAICISYCTKENDISSRLMFFFNSNLSFNVHDCHEMLACLWTENRLEQRFWQLWSLILLSIDSWLFNKTATIAGSNETLPSRNLFFCGLLYDGKLSIVSNLLFCHFQLPASNFIGHNMPWLNSRLHLLAVRCCTSLHWQILAGLAFSPSGRLHCQG